MLCKLQAIPSQSPFLFHNCKFTRKFQGFICVARGKAFDEFPLNRYSDGFFEYIERSPSLVMIGAETLKGLSSSFVAKPVSCFVDPCDESYATECARPVGFKLPVVRRIISHGEDADECFLVMDRIHCKTLEQLWPHIGLLRTI